MSGKDTTVQKIILDPSRYIAGVKEANQAMKTGMADIKKELIESSKSFSQNENQIKQWSGNLKKAVGDASKEFKSNVVTGAKALTLGFGAEAIRHTARESIDMAMEASKTFADLGSRLKGNKDDLRRWQDSVSEIAVKTKTNINSMAVAFSDLTDSANPDDILKYLDAIGGATVMNGGNSRGVTEFLKSTITGQGKQLSHQTVDEALTGADLLRRNGRGFGSLGSAMGAIGGLDQTAIRASGLSQRELASILSGASQTGSSAQASANAINQLLIANKNGMIQGSVLGGILGVGSLSGSDGRFDISKLGQSGSYEKLLNLGNGDENKAREIFASISGLGDGSDAVFNMIKNFKDMNAVVVKATADQKKFSKSVEESSDNLLDDYQGLQSTLVKGFSDIFKGFEDPIKQLFRGNVGSAIGGAPKAIGTALGGIMDHPALAIGSILTMGAGGALIKSLMKSGKLGEMGDLAKGVTFGKALQQMGVQPVYVVNAKEVGGGDSSTKDQIKDMMGAGGLPGGDLPGKSRGFLSKIASLAGTAWGLGSTGVGTLATGGVAGLGAIGLGAGAAGYAGYKAGSMIDGALGLSDKISDSFLPSDKEIFDRAERAQKMKVVVEIDMKDPQFSARPKATDNSRGGGVY